MAEAAGVVLLLAAHDRTRRLGAGAMEKGLSVTVPLPPVVMTNAELMNLDSNRCRTLVDPAAHSASIAVMGTKVIPQGPTSEQVIANLSRLRRQMKLSFEQLSTRMEAAGRPLLPTGLHRMERGLRRIDVDDLTALAKALRVDTDALLRAPDYDCSHCTDLPPRGFTCQRCGRGTSADL